MKVTPSNDDSYGSSSTKLGNRISPFSNLIPKDILTHFEHCLDMEISESEKMSEDEGYLDENDESSSEASEEYEEYPEKLYFHPGYPKQVFQALQEMKQSCFLTDLSLCTGSGIIYHAHSVVLAAVSSLIKQLLHASNEKKEGETVLHLDLAVSDLGISAVLEFAYTGTIADLKREFMAQIQTAACHLGVSRVVELCKEAKERERVKDKERNSRISSEEQMKVSLQSIRQLWDERLGCDMEIEAEGRIFRAHRVLLSASSDYVHAMFFSGMKESQQSSVSLLLMGTPELQALLHCCYSGELFLDWGCIFQLTSTALRFQFQPALSLCLRFLQEEMDSHSCLDVAAFAEAYEMSDLQQMAEDFALRHFEEVAATLKFQDLSVEKLRTYLRSDCLYVTSEFEVLKAVIAWIEANPTRRVKEARELMGTVLFPLMTYNEFKEVIAMLKTMVLSESLLKEFCSSICTAHSGFRTYLPKETLVLVGGEKFTEDLGKCSPCREIWFSNSFHNHVGIMKRIDWRMLAELPDKPRFSHGVGVIRGQLYVVGGRHYYGKNDTMECTYRYNPVQNSWQRLANMQERRGNFALVVLDDKMYAIGGDRHSEDILESVEVFCPINNSWSFVHCLDQPISDHATSVWNGNIFISGGFDHTNQCLASMLLYHPEKGTTYLEGMSESRARHIMETLQDHLYVAGGISSANGQLFDLLACEIYDPINGYWCAIMPMTVPHVSAASAVLEGKVYIVGGYCHEDYSDTKLVHRYDPKTQRWETLCGTPESNTCLAACVLSVPPHFRQ